MNPMNPYLHSSDCELELTPHEIRVQEFALAVYRYCRKFNGSVTSWCRSTARNRAVGGEPDSFHLQGLASDVVLDYPVSPALRHLLAEQLGIQLVIESDHDHLQAR